jgi:hypothetical protein
VYSYSCVKPMAHTNHTTTNQIKQPVATSVRSMETLSVSLVWANTRMRGSYAKARLRKVGCRIAGARGCAEFGRCLTRVALVDSQDRERADRSVEDSRFTVSNAEDRRFLKRCRLHCRRDHAQHDSSPSLPSFTACRQPQIDFRTQDHGPNEWRNI